MDIGSERMLQQYFKGLLPANPDALDSGLPCCTIGRVFLGLFQEFFQLKITLSVSSGPPRQPKP